MKKQRKHLIILLIILGAAVAAYFIINALADKKEADEQAASYTAYSTDPENITVLEVHNQAGSFTLAYDSDNDKWTFPDFPNETVDSSQAKLLADALREVTSDNEITSVTDPEDYGFDGSPAITIDLTFKDGTKTRLSIGDENQTISEYYFRVDDSDTIYTVDSSFYSTFNTDPTSMISSDAAESVSSGSASDSSSTSSSESASSSSAD